MKTETPEDVIKRHTEKPESDYSNSWVKRAMEEYAAQQLSALQQENKTLKATFEEFKRAMANGSELYAHLKFDDQEFTPYQLALQENEKLKEELKYCHKRMAEAYNELNKDTPSNQR